MKADKYSLSGMTLPAILILILFNLPVSGQYNENLIKAAYIERISRFIEWPVKNNTISGGSFIIGIYGENDFYNTLTEVFKEKPIKDQKAKIVLIKSPEQVNTCSLCYISGKAKPIITNFVDAANSSGVLLMSGTTDFCKKGVHINFYLENEKLKFEINEKSIVSAGFKVSYLLMQNTRIIQ